MGVSLLVKEMQTPLLTNASVCQYQSVCLTPGYTYKNYCLSVSVSTLDGCLIRVVKSYFVTRAWLMWLVIREKPRILAVIREGIFTLKPGFAVLYFRDSWLKMPIREMCDAQKKRLWKTVWFFDCTFGVYNDKNQAKDLTNETPVFIFA